MTHYKVIAVGPTINSPIWGTEFDSLKGAKATVDWLRSKGYEATVITDEEYEDEENP